MPILSPHLYYQGLVSNGLIAWYDPGWQILTGQTGQVLIDRSGNGNHGQLGSTAGVDTNDPSFANGGLTNDSDDYTTTPVLITENATIIVAWKATSLASNKAVFGANGGTNSRSYIFAATTTGAINAGVASSANIVTGLTVAVNTPYIHCLRYSGGTAHVFQNTTKSGDLAYTNTWGAKGTWIIGITGGLYNLVGVVYSMLIYNRVLSDAECLHDHRVLRRTMAGRGITI